MIDSGLDRLAQGVSSLTQGITRGLQIHDNRNYASQLEANPPLGVDPQLTSLIAQGLRNGQTDMQQAFSLISQSMPKDMASAIGQLGVQLQQAKAKGDQASVTRIQQAYNDMLDAYAQAQRKLALATHIGGGNGSSGLQLKDLVDKAIIDTYNTGTERPVNVDAGDYLDIIEKQGLNDKAQNAIIDRAVQNGFTPSQAVAIRDRVVSLVSDNMTSHWFGLDTPTLDTDAIKTMKANAGGNLTVSIPAASVGERQTNVMDRLGRAATVLEKLKSGKKTKVAGTPPAPPPEIPSYQKTVALSTKPSDDQLRGFLKAHFPTASDADVDATLADPNKRSAVESQYAKTGGK